MDVAERQAPLRARYRALPAAAMVTDRGITTAVEARDPLHCTVMPMPETGLGILIGVHRALGGLHDAPTPGDLLCAALAACMDCTLRMVANTLRIELDSLHVEVTADVDVRGALAMDPAVPIGFQSMRCSIDLRAAPGTAPGSLHKLAKVAEQCCIVRQTLVKGVAVDVSFSANGS